MGVYAFDAQFLYEALLDDAERRDSSHDFGKDLIPRMVKSGSEIYAHDFARSCVNMNGPEPYWRDVGTIDAYYDANIDLTHVVPELNLYDKGWPIWTHQEQIPPAKFVFDDDAMRGAAIDSIVSGGCIISGSAVRRSLLFTNVRVYNHSVVEDSVILPNVEIGPSAVVRNAVIDKHCKIPEGMRIGLDPAEDRRRFHVTERGRILVSPEMLGQHIHHLR
jgi:glucose-1-phosphate adenylyltransferase